ncbi:MAG: ferritin-like domain-containing protein [Phycisphaerales bacterium]
MQLDSLHKLYVHELKDLYSAEHQILEALPKMIKAAADEDLAAALKAHKTQTETHVKRLNTLFKELDYKPGGHKCKGVEGLLKEADEVVADCSDDSVRNAAIVSMAQRVEHYEMAAYGSARAFAKQLGRHEDAELLTQTLDEEADSDRKLSRIAERRLNFTAMMAGKE